MAKLSHLITWLTAALHGDTPRVNSMMIICRKDRLFTTGGRGRGAPEMTAEDAAKAVLLGLFNGTTVDCVKAVREIAELPLIAVNIAPNGPREAEQINLSRDFDKADAPLPLSFSRCPTTALEAVAGFFEHSEQPYHLCSVVLSQGACTTLSVEVIDPDIEIDSDFDSERDFFTFEAIFSDRDTKMREGWQLRGITSERYIEGPDLAELYCLMHGITDSDLSDRETALLDGVSPLSRSDAPQPRVGDPDQMDPNARREARNPRKETE